MYKENTPGKPYEDKEGSGVEKLSVGDGIRADSFEEKDGVAVDWLYVEGFEDSVFLTVDELNVDGTDENEGCTVNRLSVVATKGSEVASEDAVEKVGSVVCPRQLPLLIETSSMAKSPVKEVPLIPSNVT